MGTERNDSESEPEESLKRSMPTDELESSTGRKKRSWTTLLSRNLWN